MPDGYLVQLGDGSLNAGDGIVDPLVTFDTAEIIGTGEWVWSGTWNGFSFDDEAEPGVYHLALDGNVYFVPDFGPVDTITSANASVPPGPIDGTTGDDDPLDGTGINDVINGLEGNDVINAGAGDDEVRAGDGDDTVFGGADDDDLYGDGGDDDIFGEDGADLLVGGTGNDELFGGADDDVLYGDNDPTAPAQQETFSWAAAGADNTELAGTTVVQTTGLMEVTVDIANDGGLSSATIDETTENYTEILDDSSSLYLQGNGGTDVSTIGVSFSVEAENVFFRINDFDTGTWTDQVTINAFDADGNPVTVTITPEDANNTVSGNTATSGITNVGADDPEGSLLVEIAGPVASFDIIYTNAGSSTQWLWVTDIAFDEPIIPGDDILDGGLGADDMFGGGGNDTFFLADGDEAYGEDGDDIFILGDLGETASTILIDGGEDGETGGDTLQLNGQGSLSDVVFDVGNPESGTITLTDGTVVNFSNIENIICFTPGTLIATPFGTRRIETLVKGDLVLTRDNGPQPIRWIGSRAVLGTGDFAPIELSPSAFPEANAPLLVSPQHRMLFTGYRAELLFGESEVLVAAKHLLGGAAVRIRPQRKVTYIHIMFDRHEIITANGALTESFFAADQSLSALNDPARDELFSIFPELRSSQAGPTARRALRAYEATLL